MATTNAVYVDGGSQLPQARPASLVEPVYGDGQSGFLPILGYTAPTGQFARPSAYVADGNWLNQNSRNHSTAPAEDLYASIDEVTASDADYIRSGTAPTNDTCTVSLGTIATPDAGTVTIRIRGRFL